MFFRNDRQRRAVFASINRFSPRGGFSPTVEGFRQAMFEAMPNVIAEVATSDELDLYYKRGIVPSSLSEKVTNLLIEEHNIPREVVLRSYIPSKESNSILKREIAEVLDREGFSNTLSSRDIYESPDIRQKVFEAVKVIADRNGLFGYSSGSPKLVGDVCLELDKSWKSKYGSRPCGKEIKDLVNEALDFYSDDTNLAPSLDAKNGDNSFALYLDQNSKRVRSTDFPEVDFKLKADLEPNIGMSSVDEALKVLGSSPDEYYAGVTTVEVDLKPVGSGRLGTYTPHLDEERLGKAKEDIERRYEWLAKEYKVHDPTRLNFLADHKSNAYDNLARVGEKQVNTPAVRIHHFRGMGSNTPRVLAHELGHHIDAETREERSSHKEPIADAIADITYGGKTWRKYPPRWKEHAVEHAEYAVALKEAKTPSFEELSRYTGENEI